MTVLAASLKRSILEAAKAYLASGVSIVPLKGKQPTIQWVPLQQKRPSMSNVLQWHHRGQLTGVGVICGRVSGNLVVLDFDSHEAVDEFSALFPTLLDTFTVLSGSGRGAHFYYYVKDLPETTVVKNFELRANGCYVVAPPSPHPSGNFYTVKRPVNPMLLSGMASVVKWIKSKRNAIPVTTTPQTPAPRPVHTGGFLPREEYFRRRYVDKAFRVTLSFISGSTEGSRNMRLYGGSVSVGQLVGSGDLPRALAESELLNAALQCGLDQTEAVATIKSGLDTGILSPRRVPPPPKPNH